ncbi:PIN domain-containing protein [bacterium]|nr:PIN domain-containing protein [bacterium]
MIFIDTGAFLARYIARDQYHKKSVRGWNLLRKDRTHCYTSNFVLDETITLLARQAGYEFASARAYTIYKSGLLEILRPDFKDELEALEFFQKFSDQKVSFTDCVSFVLMKRNRINLAFSFDRHFVLAGFDIFPTE